MVDFGKLWPKAAKLLPISTTALLLVACDIQPNSDAVPVDLTPLNAGTTDTSPVETSLYEYSEDAEERREFKIKRDVAPLRFAFPAVYYANEANLKGGPQAWIELDVDPIEFGPARILPVVGPAKTQFDRRLSQEYHRRHMTLLIASNIFVFRGPLRPDEDRPPIERVSRSIKKDRVPQFDSETHGFKFWAISPHETKDPNPKSVLFGYVDLYKFDYIAFPISYKSNPIKMIKCIRWSDVCRVSMFYKGRVISINPQKEQMNDIESIASGVVALVKKYELGGSSRQIG